jgi:hypothetical protein
VEATESGVVEAEAVRIQAELRACDWAPSGWRRGDWRGSDNLESIFILIT